MQQNISGNPSDFGVLPNYFFRPVPPPEQLRAPNLTHEWSGGDFGWAFHKNPVTPTDTNGAEHHYGTEMPTFKPPLLLDVNSDNRDMVVYPNVATFRMKFMSPPRGIKSLEVLNFNFPNPQTPPADRRVLLLMGIFQGTGFMPQLSHHLGIYHPMVTTDLTAGAPMNTVSKWALAKMFYDVTRPDQHWCKREVRQIRLFNPLIEHLDFLEFTLAYSDGSPLDLPPDSSWSITLEIVCKAN